jgi:hypothetical protein
VTRFQCFSLAALVRKKRTDAGVHRAVPIEIKVAIEGLELPGEHTIGDADDGGRSSAGFGDRRRNGRARRNDVSGLTTGSPSDSIIHGDRGPHRAK